MSDQLKHQLAAARRRLNLGHFLRVLILSLTGTLAAGCIVVLVDRLMGTGIGLGWVLGGSAVAGVVGACGIWFATRRSDWDAAVTIDRAFGLKERISTLLALDEETAAEPAAEALKADVDRCLGNVLVADKVAVAMPRHSWLPAVPLAAILLIGAYGPAAWIKDAMAKGPTPEEQERIVQQAELLGQAIKERTKALEESELSSELEELTNEIEATGRDIAKNKKLTPKEASLKLSELSKSVEERRENLKSNELVQKNLQKLQSLGEGPAEKLADALKNGDFKEAAKQLEEMKKKIASGSMAEEEKKKLAEQMNNLQKQLNQLADLQQRAEQLAKSLPPEMLKQELQKLAQDSAKMQQLKDLAKQLGECSKCMGEQDGEGKGNQQSDLAKSMAEAQKILDELRKEAEARELLDKILDDLAQCQGGMCKGEGKPGPGLGEGRGEGDRPEAETEYKGREQQARAKAQKGEAFITGRVKGNNFKGESKLEIREAAQAAARDADEAITRQKVPREYQEHTREYFDRLNGQLK